MKHDRTFFTSPLVQIALATCVLLAGVLVMRGRRHARALPPLPAAKPAPVVPLPQTLVREGVRFISPPPPPVVSPLQSAAAKATATPAPVRDLPLVLATAAVTVPDHRPVAPYGRLIACETVLALESNRLDTPILGLVTADVWHDGRRVIPAGAEVHGRALLDRTRERLGAQNAWHIVWRTNDQDNGEDLAVEGLILNREVAGRARSGSETDGSAGLRGQLIKTGNDRELKLFASSFLAAATGALQEVRPTAGLLGESSVPVTTVRNAALAGTGAVLRDYAQAMREAIARDGFYLHVPAGKPFYLYVTQPLDRRLASRRIGAAAEPLHP